MTLEARVARSLAAVGTRPGTAVGIACSGGADSVALLHLAARVHEGRVVAMHVDHGMRVGTEADEAFVRRTALLLGVDVVSEPLFLEVPPGESVEAFARTARYDSLTRMANDAKLDLVATAHTLDDQAETVILRAMRGSSLAAIAPVRGRFVRPLLDVRRDELRGWLIANGIDWREDPTNDDLRLERNWVRRVLMPQLRERRAGVDLALARVASRQRVDDATLDAMAQEVFDRAQVDDVGVFIDAADIRLVPPAVASRVVRVALRHIGTDPTADETERVRLAGSGRLTVGSADVWRFAGGLVLIRRPVAVPQPVILPTQGTIVDRTRGLRVRVGSAEREPWRWRVVLPPSEALGHIEPRIRARRPGDRVRSSSGSRKVSDVLIDAKVPRPLRDLVGIVAGERGALAVVGHTPSATAASSGTVVDVEPVGGSWSRELLWTAS